MHASAQSECRGTSGSWYHSCMLFLPIMLCHCADFHLLCLLLLKLVPMLYVCAAFDLPLTCIILCCRAGFQPPILLQSRCTIVRIFICHQSCSHVVRLCSFSSVKFAIILYDCADFPLPLKLSMKGLDSTHTSTCHWSWHLHCPLGRCAPASRLAIRLYHCAGFHLPLKLSMRGWGSMQTGASKSSCWTAVTFSLRPTLRSVLSSWVANARPLHWAQEYPCSWKQANTKPRVCCWQSDHLLHPILRWRCLGAAAFSVCCCWAVLWSINTCARAYAR